MSAGLADMPLMTAEQLFDLPDDGLRHELVEGVLATMSPTGLPHGRVCARIAVRLGGWTESHPEVGETYTNDPGFLLGRHPDTVRAPDLAVVAQARSVPEYRGRGYAAFAPDLVVEVVSPSDRASDVTAKALAWVAAGVRLVWIVDPQARIATVYRPGNGLDVVRDDGALDGEDVVPGFVLPLAEIFAE